MPFLVFSILMVALVAVRRAARGELWGIKCESFHSVMSWTLSGTVHFFFLSFFNEWVYSPTLSKKKKAMMTRSAMAL